MHQESHQSSHEAPKISQWRCPNCGQIFFTAVHTSLPAMCGICHERIVWEELGNHPRRWRCPNCGQTLFTAPDDPPPDLCDYCRDYTTWSRIFD